MASDGPVPTSDPGLSILDHVVLPSLPSLSTGAIPDHTEFAASSTTFASSTTLSSSTSAVASDSSTSSTPVPTPVPTPTQLAATDPDTTASKSDSTIGLIIGLIFAILVLLALILFLVRCMFIRHRRQHRASGQSLAYSKAKYAISAPTNFTVVESGTFDGKGIERPGTSMSVQPGLEDRGNGGNGERVGTPERMRERYPFDAMSGLESGLKDQMQTMKHSQLGSRKPVPVYTAEAADTR